MGLGSIHSFLIKRMTAVAEEIFNALKDNITEYEQEIERLRQENCCLRSALTETHHGQSSIHYKLFHFHGPCKLNNALFLDMKK